MYIYNRYSQAAQNHTAKITVPPQTSSRILGLWLFTVCFFIAVLVVFGGFVRLTRSGLSIVEWDIVTGVVPPIGDTAWQETFEKYRQTPESQLINPEMTLPEYKFIYYMEYFHRLLGRLTGLLLVVPLIVFLIKRTIPLRKSPVYLGLAALFALQGFMGWYMVQSGLVDQPHVSHYRLTAHLLLALLLFAGCFWLGLNNTFGTAPLKAIPASSSSFKLSLGLLGAIILQITYGGFVAGLKAGHISDTFPLMSGYLIPPGLLSWLEPWPLNLISNPITVHFLHRWIALVVLALTLALYFEINKTARSRTIRVSAVALLLLVSVQILLGIAVIFWHVPISLALVHQAVALMLFAIGLYINHQVILKAQPR